MKDRPSASHQGIQHSHNPLHQLVFYTRSLPAGSDGSNLSSRAAQTSPWFKICMSWKGVSKAKPGLLDVLSRLLFCHICRLLVSAESHSDNAPAAPLGGSHQRVRWYSRFLKTTWESIRDNFSITTLGALVKTLSAVQVLNMVLFIHH